MHPIEHRDLSLANDLDNTYAYVFVYIYYIMVQMTFFFCDNMVQMPTLFGTEPSPTIFGTMLRSAVFGFSIHQKGIVFQTVNSKLKSDHCT